MASLLGNSGCLVLGEMSAGKQAAPGHADNAATPAPFLIECSRYLGRGQKEPRREGCC